MKLENIKSKTDYNMKKVTQSKQIHAQRPQKKNTRTKCETCSKLLIETPEQHH